MNKAFQPQKSSPKDKKDGENRPKLRKKISVRYLENSGAYYLQRFAASTAQFRKVMERKIDLSCRDHPDQKKEECLKILDDLVIKFTDLGFLNDFSYAQGLSYSLKMRGYSRKKMFFTMKLKGLSEEIILSHLSDDDEHHYFISDLVQAVKFAKRKKIGAFSLKERNDQRALNALARAGFDYETSRRVLSLPLDEGEDILHSASR